MTIVFCTGLFRHKARITSSADTGRAIATACRTDRGRAYDVTSAILVCARAAFASQHGGYYSIAVGVYEIAGLDSPLERGTGMWDWNVGLEYCLCNKFLPHADRRPQVQLPAWEIAPSLSQRQYSMV